MNGRSFEALSFAIDVLFKATLLLGFAGVVRLFLRRGSASLRQAIGVLTLGALLALPAIAPMLPDWKVPVIPTLLTGPEVKAEPARGRIVPAVSEKQNRQRRRESHSERIAERIGKHAATASADGTASPVRAADFGYGVVPKPEVEAVGAARAALQMPSAATVVTILFVLWGAGAAGLLIHLALGIGRVRRHARQAEPARDERWAELARELSGRLGLTPPGPVPFHRRGSRRRHGRVLSPDPPPPAGRAALVAGAAAGRRAPRARARAPRRLAPSRPGAGRRRDLLVPPARVAFRAPVAAR